MAPEKRPSVTSATDSPRPAPTIAAGDAEHLAHPGAALRPFVANDHDIAGLDAASLHGREGCFLAVEHACRTSMNSEIVSGDFHDASVGREVASEDDETACGFQRR